MISFYAFNKEKFILVTNFKKETVKKKFGHNFELLTSIKDFNALEVVKSRILKQYPFFSLKEQLLKPIIFTPEIREKLRQKKLGTKKPDWVKEKISQSRKGVGNFLGKSHTEEFKRAKSLKTKNVQKEKGKRWIYNPTEDKESIIIGDDIPPGYVLGRSTDMREVINYNFEKGRTRNKTSTTPPTKK